MLVDPSVQNAQLGTSSSTGGQAGCGWALRDWDPMGLNRLRCCARKLKKNDKKHVGRDFEVSKKDINRER